MAAEAVGAVWAGLGGSGGWMERVGRVGPGGTLPSRLDVTGMAVACVAAASLAAAELGAARGLVWPRPAVDSRAVAVAFAGERYLRVDGEARPSFAPLSRFWRAADGWVRTHGNYPHHRARLLESLGLDPSGEDVTAVERVIAASPAREVEDAVFTAGGLAVAVRTAAEWSAHPQGAAVATGPLVRISGPGAGRTLEAAALPMGGLRVLDLTRVIAGPVGTRTLALLGADVLRIDSPRNPEIPAQHLETGSGKRSALLDLDRADDLARLHELVDGADAVVTGYRPGALDRYGLSPEELLGRRPELVAATLSAWGTDGPWSSRRGFDSLVQAASGIALVEGDPGALPVQALDHGTGYLLAAAVMRALTDGGGRHVELSLARTAAWLLQQKGRDEGVEFDPAPYLDVTADGRVRYALPPIGGGPRTWTHPATPWGSDEPVWLA